MDKKILKDVVDELSKEHDVYGVCHKAIEVSSKYVLKDSPNNEAFKKGAEERLVRIMSYCAFEEQPFSSEIAIRILRESETNKELMAKLQYDYSVEFERSVNEVLYACLNFYYVAAPSIGMELPIYLGVALSESELEEVMRNAC